MFDSEKFAAWVASQSAAKTYDPKGGRAFATEPLDGDALKAVLAIAPEDKWSDALRRIVRLGGDRLNAIDKEVEAVLAGEQGKLLKATAASLAGSIADKEITTPVQEGTTPEAFRKAVRESVVKAAKSWADENAEARAAIKAAIASIQGAINSAGFSEVDLASARDAIGVLSGLGMIAEKKAA